MRIDINKLELAQARCGKTLSQLGVSRETLRNIKRGHNVLPQTVFKCASALGVSVDEILAEGGDRA